MDAKLHDVHRMVKIPSKKPVINGAVVDSRSGIAKYELPVAFRL